MKTDFFRQFSVKLYLLALFIIISTTPVILLSIIQYSFLNNNILSILENNNLSLAKALANKVELYLESNNKIVNLLAYEIEFKSDPQIKNLFSNIIKTNEDFSFIIYSDKSESIYYDKQNHLKRFDSKTLVPQHYQIINQLLKKPETYFISKIQLPGKNAPVIGIISPIIKDSILKGYLFGGIKFDKIQSYTNGLSDIKQEAFIVDLKDNNIIFPLSVEKKSLNSKKNILNSLKRTNSGIIEDYKPGKGEEKIISFTRFNSSEWAIWLEHPLSMYEKEIQRYSLRTLAAALISLGFALILALWVAASQHQFVKNLLSSIHEIAKGNYSKKAKTEVFFLPKEFHYLLSEFNLMAERIEQLDNFKSNLIDTVSHEFRTPLTSIKGFSSTLLRKDVTFEKEMQRKLLKIISDQSDRLSRMVEDLLVVPKLEGNVLKLDVQEIDLEQTIEHISEFFAGDTFEINVEEQLTVIADSDRLEQVLVNLFENAHKYSYPQGSKIKVEAFRDNWLARIVVSNPAEKVAPEKLQSLFNKFVRLDDTLTRTTGGTGLGLYITKGLIELMGGKIWLETDEEYFHVNFTLPLKLSARGKYFLSKEN